MKNKVVHLCLANFYTDGYSYQENMLPKFHQKLGYETAIIASLDTFNKAGQFVQYSGDLVYRNEYDIPVRRLPYRSPEKLYRILRRYQGVREALEQAKPDMLFIHGCQFSDIDIVADYLKAHPDVKVYVDNHADFNNSATNYLSKNILHRRIWKRCAHVIEPYTSKFYGVVPARVDFLKEMYGLPAHKCDLLVMGADDDAVEKALRPEVRAKRRRARVGRPIREGPGSARRHRPGRYAYRELNTAECLFRDKAIGTGVHLWPGVEYSGCKIEGRREDHGRAHRPV